MKALACVAVLLISQTSVPFPQRDSFVYPGQPGSDGMVDFNRRWEEFNRNIPEAGRRERSGELAWMEGRWTVAVRDYFYEPPKPGRIETMVRGTAVIAFTPEQKWLTLSAGRPVRNPRGWCRGRSLGRDLDDAAEALARRVFHRGRASDDRRASAGS